MGIFDNAESVVINGHEVQSIIDSNGGVLYEKQSGDNYLLTLTSDKDILSYYDRESALLTATLTNNEVGVQGEMVRFDGFLLDTPITRSITQNTETHVGSKYILSNIPITNLNKIFLNKEHTVYITKDAVDGVKIYWPNGGSGDETSNISVENGIITYSRGGTTYTEDCSSYDMSVVYSQVSGFSINDYGVFAVTDSSGVATVSYESKGTGDLNIKVDCMNLQETYSIEDIYFARMTEYSCVKDNGYSKQQLIDNNLSLDIPDDFELTFQVYFDGASSWNHQEQRVFILPNSLYVEGSQPYLAFFVGDTYCGEWEAGVRRGGSTVEGTKKTLSCREYRNVKITRQGNGRINFYPDNTYFDYWTLDDAFNYHDWNICFHLWHDGTVKIRNIKLKEL